MEEREGERREGRDKTEGGSEIRGNGGGRE